MRAIIGVAAAGLTVVAIGFWLNSTISRSAAEISVSKAASTPAISVLEIHNQAHLEFLPVQHIDDQSLVFADESR
jgi:hypothetical protein